MPLCVTCLLRVKGGISHLFATEARDIDLPKTRGGLGASPSLLARLRPKSVGMPIHRTGALGEQGAAR